MFNYNHTHDYNVNTHDAWHRRKVTLENLFSTTITIARAFIEAGKPQLAGQILAAAEDAKGYFCNHYHIKVWEGGENFITIKFYELEKIKAVVKNIDSAKMYLHEFESAEGCINLAIIIDCTNGEEEIE